MEQAKAPSTTMALIWALLAIFVCGPIGGVLSIIYGNRVIREVRESGHTLSGSGTGRFAQIVGWISVIAYLAAFLIVGITYAGR